jgi:hypothetical protein
VSADARRAPIAGVARRLGDADRLADGLHWLVLLAGLVFLLVVLRHHWFDTDEWDALLDRRLTLGGSAGILSPHNEHWSTVPILAYRLLFSVFHLKTYVPYLVMVVVAHLVVAELLWLLLRRVGVDRWVALVALAGFVFLAAGVDDFLSPWQSSFDLSLAAGLGALLLLPGSGPWRRRDAWVWGLLVVGLASSGIGLTMLAVVVLAQLLRRGWRVALVTLSVPAAVYVAWYAGYGHRSTAGGPEPFTTAVQQVPAFVWHGLVDPVSTTLSFAGVGVVVVVLLAIWALRHAEVRTEPWSIVAAMAIGAPLFLAGTALRRVQYGPTAGAAPRYAYVTLALLLPLAALAVSAALDRVPWRALGLAGGAAVLLLVGVSTIRQDANADATRQQHQKARILAVAALARTTSNFLSQEVVPLPPTPYLTVAKLHRLDVDGALPSVAPTLADRLSALGFVQAALGADRHLPRGPSAARVVGVNGATAHPAATPGCVDVVAASDHPTVHLQLLSPVSLRVRPDRSAPSFFELDQGPARGLGYNLVLRGQATQFLNIDAPGTFAAITVPPLGTTELCGTAPAPGVAGGSG